MNMCHLDEHIYLRVFGTLGPNRKCTADPGSAVRAARRKTQDRIIVTAVICACSITGISCSLRNVSEQLSHCQDFLRGRVMAAGAPSPGPTGQSGEEQTVVSFHWKHMVKLKCVIYRVLRVATEEHTHTHARTHIVEYH